MMGPPEIQFVTSTSPNDVGLVEAEGAGGSKVKFTGLTQNSQVDPAV
jgi:hypothetical protein